MKRSEVGGYFGGFVISAVEKMMKPDEKIFGRLFGKFSLNPRECFFVDDTEKNILAGRKCGMACRFSSPTPGLLLSTSDTAAGDTPNSRAISFALYLISFLSRPAA